MQELVHKVYRVGPASLTIVMAVGSAAYSPWQHRDTWAVYPVVFGVFAAALWHVALIATERPRLRSVAYAVWHLPLCYVVGLYCLGAVTGDWL